jgi:hypothetical protein
MIARTREVLAVANTENLVAETPGRCFGFRFILDGTMCLQSLKFARDQCSY